LNLRKLSYWFSYAYLFYFTLGSYQCIAQSDYESSQATAELKLGDIAPVILDSFKDSTVVDSNTPLSLRCSASATPLPQIKWFLDDWPVPNFARFRVGDYVTHDAKVVSYVNITSTRVVDGGEVSLTVYMSLVYYQLICLRINTTQWVYVFKVKYIFLYIL
jgi:hypothetical protein